jgi:predicted RNA-binding protein YlqC (UPF0109 family)
MTELQTATSAEARAIEGMVKALVTGLIAYPEHLEIATREMNQSVLIEVRAHCDDTGKLLGYRRQTYLALQTLVGLAAMRFMRIARLRVLDSVVGKPQGMAQFRPRDDWNMDRFDGILHRTLETIFVSYPGFKASHFTGGVSIYEVHVKQSEIERVPWRRVNESIKTVFDAIGKSMGRETQVELFTEGAK